ncbi:MAG: type II toxin-antitoxin system PemK/MazF family toxin [Planctomycetes bacterium]|nr:type II toxin-antitoxin system PemK/MazF family toxin [Planctomycetota bacterium]
MDFPKRGEIWLVSLEPVIGREIGKTRPAVVISNDQNNQFEILTQVEQSLLIHLGISF